MLKLCSGPNQATDSCDGKSFVMGVLFHLVERGQPLGGIQFTIYCQFTGREFEEFQSMANGSTTRSQAANKPPIQGLCEDEIPYHI